MNVEIDCGYQMPLAVDVMLKAVNKWGCQCVVIISSNIVPPPQHGEGALKRDF